MTLFHKAAKPVCQELVTVTTTEVAQRVDRTAEDMSDLLEIGIMAIALIASIVMPHNSLFREAASLINIPSGVKILEIGHF